MCGCVCVCVMCKCLCACGGLLAHVYVSIRACAFTHACLAVCVSVCARFCLSAHAYLWNRKNVKTEEVPRIGPDQLGEVDVDAVVPGADDDGDEHGMQQVHAVGDATQRQEGVPRQQLVDERCQGQKGHARYTRCNLHQQCCSQSIHSTVIT